MKRPPTDLTRLRETGSTLDIWRVPYKVAGGVSVSLYWRCEDVCNGGPRQGCNRDNCGIGVVACIRRIESGSFLETPSSHVKLAKDKVERRFLTLIWMKGDHRLYDLQFYFLFYASMLDISTVARNRTISHNTNIVFSLGGHRLEGSPIWLDAPYIPELSYIFNGVRMRLGSASLTYAYMALLNS